MRELSVFLVIGFIVTTIILALMFGLPRYSVWQQGLAGEAELKRAQQNRQITVEEAEAKREASKALAQAEVIRAGGVAEANKIIAEGLGGPQGYLRYLFIDALKDLDEKGSQIIYIPTEAGIPILEAGRR